jgi:hypothetical protein
MDGQETMQRDTQCDVHHERTEWIHGENEVVDPPLHHVFSLS